jgi:hypothetical protein
MFRLLFIALVLPAMPAMAMDNGEFDPSDVSITDAVNCHIDAPTYNSFALAVVGQDNLAERRGWRKIDRENPFLAEYELPEEEWITGRWWTRRVAFTSSGVLAILDLADPGELAANEDITNEADFAGPDEDVADAAASASPEALNAAAQIGAVNPPVTDNDHDPAAGFTKFMGERVLVDVTEPANEHDSFGTRTIIARSISNVASHQGKTLYGCAYRIELLDRDGNPL